MTDKSTTQPNKPFLAGVLVLDLAEGGVALCSRLLADLGATVVKVEPPGGDPERRRDEAAFLYHNANKLGTTLDPAVPKDVVRFRNLLAQADVLVETFSKERAEALGVTPEQTTGTNPTLIHLSVTGFGKSGPRAGFRWCDEVLSAFGGQACLTGPRLGAPRSFPYGQPFYVASLFGAVAALLALKHRRHTGKGCYLDLSVQEAMVSTLDHVLVDYFRNGTICTRRGNIYGDGSFAIFPAADGHILLGLTAAWETIMELAAAEGKAQDLLGGEWRDPAYRASHLDRVLASLGEWTRAHSKEELFALGQGMRFAWAPVYRPEEVVESPQLVDRRFFTSVPLPSSGETSLLPRLPCKFRLFSPPPPDKPPGLGEHNEVVSGPSFASASREKIYVTPRDESGDAGKGVLRGVRVLDFTWMLAGPYATRVLADFGADVIKVQPPKATRGGLGSDPFYEATWNRNKRSLALDPDRPEGRAVVQKLVSRADVVVENFSPRVMENWGFSYDDLKKIKPDIVMASISAMGHTGPWKDRVGFGPTFHALSGLVSEASAGLDTPVCPGHAYGDTVIGLYAVLAVLAALERKEATGQGEYIDLSGFEALCTLLGPVFMKTGAGMPGGQTCPAQGHVGWYRCRGEDRWCVVAFGDDADWQRFLAASGLTPAGSPLSGPGETEWRERDRCVASWTAGRTRDDVVETLQSGGLAAAAVQDARDLVRDPQLLFRRFFVSLDHPTLGTLRSDRSALPRDDMAREEWKAAPLPGEDTKDVLGGLLGLSEEEMTRYAEEDVIAGPLREQKEQVKG